MGEEEERGKAEDQEQRKRDRRVTHAGYPRPPESFGGHPEIRPTSSLFQSLKRAYFHCLTMYKNTARDEIDYFSSSS